MKFGTIKTGIEAKSSWFVEVKVDEVVKWVKRGKKIRLYRVPQP